MDHNIIGSGTIGKAFGEALEAHSYEVSYNDINQKTVDELKEEGKEASTEIDADADVYWVCTGEKSVEQALDQLDSVVDDAVVVIRSSTRPGTTEAMNRKFDMHISHMPEFLKERSASFDALNPNRIIIGEHCDTCVSEFDEVLKKLNAEVHRTDSETSELVKLVSNSYLSMLIGFWNQVKEYTDDMDLDPQRVSNLSKKDPRISDYGTYMWGESPGGPCLPKDLKQMKELAEENDIDNNLIESLLEWHGKNNKSSKGL